MVFGANTVFCDNIISGVNMLFDQEIVFGKTWILVKGLCLVKTVFLVYHKISYTLYLSVKRNFTYAINQGSICKS